MSSNEEEDHYKHLGARTLPSAWDLYQKEDWKLERQQGQDCVFTRKDPKVGTVFKLTTEVSASQSYLRDELYFGVSNLAKWNSSIKESHKVQTIDEYTDIIYQVSEDAVGGLIRSRDFLSLRHWAYVEDTYVLATVKCDHPTLPPGGKYVRAENGVGCYVIESIPNEENRCCFTWIINPNLNMMLPKIILDREIMKMMLVFARDLRIHIDKITARTE